MPRKLRDTELDTATARTGLRPRGEPYWRRVSKTCHLGYRRNRTGGGSWVARFYDGERYVESTLGVADDELPPDGAKVLTFSDAQEAARRWFAEQARRSVGLEPEDAEPYTVARCMADYLEWMAVHRKAETTRYTVAAHILPADALGPRPVAELTTREIRRWHQELAAKPARVRSAKGKPPGARTTDRPDHERKRKTTANRVLAILKAGLNFAYREGRVPTDDAWRRVKPFKGVEAPRIRFLDQEEAKRLLNACDADFRRLVQAALLTGCRYGELTRLRVSDYSTDLGAVYIREAKSQKARHVYLNADGAALFESVTAGRTGAERIFLRADGGAWGKAHQIRRMEDASATARIEPAVSFHLLRHTYASLYLMNGGDLPALAQQLGHADTRMTVRHYGHLAESWRAEQARRHAPSFGAPRAKVTALRAR